MIGVALSTCLTGSAGNHTSVSSCPPRTSRFSFSGRIILAQVQLPTGELDLELGNARFSIECKSQNESPHVVTPIQSFAHSYLSLRSGLVHGLQKICKSGQASSVEAENDEILWMDLTNDHSGNFKRVDNQHRTRGH